jgi:curved DNA-binding protein CbpA
MIRDYYYILGIKNNASEQEIKAAYRKLSKKFHPDVNEGEKFFEERFKDIQEAYETVSNPAKRKEYDWNLNQFYSSSSNKDDLKNAEERIRCEYEAEFKKREEENRRKQEQEFKKRVEENKRKQEEEYLKRKEESKRKQEEKMNKIGNNVLYILMVIITVFLIFGVLEIIKNLK